MVWIDLDNSPHVPLYEPIIKELEKRGEEYFITARDFAQTIDLCNMMNLKYTAIGKHGGKGKIAKVLNLFQRAEQLKKAIDGKKINLAISHGSRTQVIASKRMKIPSILMLDYEYTENKIFNIFADYILMPAYIPDEVLDKAGFNLKKIIRYNGFKEELYLNNFVPEDNFRKEIGIDENEILIVIRPPSLVGNYSNKHSESLFIDAIKFISETKAKSMIISRTKEDRELINNLIKGKKNIKFLEKVVNGLQLIYAADIFLSGGGTMNREAALLGTETYSIFKGRKPYLDEYLEKVGKMRFINSKEDFKRIKIEKKEKYKEEFENSLVKEITDIILDKAKL
jgi:predicted glycosyltransferase